MDERKAESTRERAERYRARAQILRDRAERMKDAVARESLVRTAADWEMLASHIERVRETG